MPLPKNLSVPEHLLLIGVSLLFACGATRPLPAPEPIDSDSAGLGFWLKMRAPLRFVNNKPDVVLFVRLEEGEGLWRDGPRQTESNNNIAIGTEDRRAAQLELIG